MSKLRALSFALVAVLLMATVYLFLTVDEKAYMAWTRGAAEPPGQTGRDLSALACVVAAGVVAWVGRRL